MYEIITPGNVANRHASGLSIAKAFIELDPRTSKFLASNLVNDRSFINERVKDLANSTGKADFYRVIIQVIDREKNLTNYEAKDICDAIDKWAGYSDVSGSRGGRLAIVSQVHIDEDGNFEHITAADGTPVLYFEAWISTAVIYNHRRATLNHSKDATEFGADARNLFEKILDVDDSVDIAVEHQYFGVYQHGNIKF